MTAAGMWHSDGSVDYEFLSAKTQIDWAFDVVLTLMVGEGALVVTGRKESGEREFKVTDSGLWDCADQIGGISARFQ